MLVYLRAIGTNSKTKNEKVSKASYKIHHEIHPGPLGNEFQLASSLLVLA